VKTFEQSHKIFLRPTYLHTLPYIGPFLYSKVEYTLSVFALLTAIICSIKFFAIDKKRMFFT